MRLTLSLFLVWTIVKAAFADFRLPDTVRPTDYRLRILTHLNDDNLAFEGTETIELLVLLKTNTITLHAKHLQIDETYISLKHSEKKSSVLIDFVEQNLENDLIILHLGEDLEENETYRLSMLFSADLRTDFFGYYRSSYKTATNETRWLSATHFEPDKARLAFPCFDEPHLKATFSIKLGHHKQYQALSNMPLISQRLNPDLEDYVWSDFMESPPMSTYLVAFTIHDFVSKAATNKDFKHVKYNVWARSDVIERCTFVAELGPMLFEYFEELYDIIYPLPKLDLVAYDYVISGGMENWGLITINEDLILVDEDESSFQSKQETAVTIAHEISHNWFGNMVTMKSWSELWLKEGFATYVSGLAVNNIYPEWNFMNSYVLRHILAVFQMDGFETIYPIADRPGEKGIEKSQMIVYGKTSIVLRMLHSIVGEEAFHIGMREYLKKYAFGNADQDDLWQALSQAAHIAEMPSTNRSIKTVMSSWLTQPGYPIITVTRNYNKRTASIKQKRFLFYSDEQPNNACWWVPLSYTSQKELDFTSTAPTDWLDCADSSGTNKLKIIRNTPRRDNWLIFNLKFSTLCRVDYDDTNWQLIIKTLTEGNHESIHELNRAQLIDDALSLAWVSELDYNIAIQLIMYLKREREHLPWSTAMGQLSKINHILKHLPDYSFFREFMHQILEPLFDHIEEADHIEDNAVSHRSTVAHWACQYDILNCLNQALEYFNEWRRASEPDIVNQIPLELRQTVYCTALRHGGPTNWGFLKLRFERSQDADERDRLLRGLGCTRNQLQLKRYIELIFDGTKKYAKLDKYSMLRVIMDNEHGFPLFNKYVQSHKNIFKDSNLLQELRNTLAERHMQPSDIATLIDLLAKYGRVNKKYLIKDLQTNMRMTADWVKFKKNQFFRALNKHTSTQTSLSLEKSQDDSSDSIFLS